MGPPESARSTVGHGADLSNRRVRTRTHGGVGGREGRPSLRPDTVVEPSLGQNQRLTNHTNCGGCCPRVDPFRRAAWRKWTSAEAAASGAAEASPTLTSWMPGLKMRSWECSEGISRRLPWPLRASERRLAAILAADVVGYSRLMAADEAGTHARLKALRKDFIEPKIAEHHGRVVKLMGDGALVEFASVVDAVECAVGDPERRRRAPGGAARGPAHRVPHRHQHRRRHHRGRRHLRRRGERRRAPRSAGRARRDLRRRATSTTRSRARSPSASSRWASTGSRTSPSRSRCIG